MVDLNQIEQRLSAFDASRSTKYDAVVLALLDDIRSLLREVRELRSLCDHAHCLQMQDAQGNLLPAFACVNCHQVLTRQGVRLADFADDDRTERIEVTHLPSRRMRHRHRPPRPADALRR